MALEYQAIAASVSPRASAISPSTTLASAIEPVDLALASAASCLSRASSARAILAGGGASPPSRATALSRDLSRVRTGVRRRRELPHPGAACACFRRRLLGVPPLRSPERRTSSSPSPARAAGCRPPRVPPQDLKRPVLVAGQPPVLRPLETSPGGRRIHLARGRHLLLEFLHHPRRPGIIPRREGEKRLRSEGVRVAGQVASPLLPGVARRLDREGGSGDRERGGSGDHAEPGKRVLRARRKKRADADGRRERTGSPASQRFNSSPNSDAERRFAGSFSSEWRQTASRAAGASMFFFAEAALSTSTIFR